MDLLQRDAVDKAAVVDVLGAAQGDLLQRCHGAEKGR